MRKDSMEAIRKMEPAWQKIAASNFRLGREKNGDLACISKKCCIFAKSIAKNLKLKGI